MTDPTPGDYGRALQELHEASEEVKRIVAQLESFTYRLSRFPGETCFVDVDDEPVPPLDELIPGARWHAANFPSPSQIQHALRRRHEARVAATKIWDRLSEFQRRGMPRVGR